MCACGHTHAYTFALCTPYSTLMSSVWTWDVRGERRGVAHWRLGEEHRTQGPQESFPLEAAPMGGCISCFISGIGFSDKHMWNICEKCQGAANSTQTHWWHLSPQHPLASLALDISTGWTCKVVGEETIYITVFASQKNASPFWVKSKGYKSK